MTYFEKCPLCKESTKNTHWGQRFFFFPPFALFFIFWLYYLVTKQKVCAFFKLEAEYECHKYFIFIAHLALFLTFRPCQQSTQ